MEHSKRITILGRDHEAKGEIYMQSLDFLPITLGTSAGTTLKPNEDAVGVSVQGSEMILAIADGHWGREASELSVSKAMELLGPESLPIPESESQPRLFSLFEQINSQLYDMAASAPAAATPETTLVVGHIRETENDKFLHWASFGDSYIFLLRKETLKQLNSLESRWLGYLSKLSEKNETRAVLMRTLVDKARYVGVADGLETGMEKLESGDIVFLCTDGLIGADRDPNPAQLYGIRMLLLSDLPIESKVEKAIASALARGEKDNITCLAAQIGGK
jgi:serine/threonine protein phosphatase PrpC